MAGMYIKKCPECGKEFEKAAHSRDDKPNTWYMCQDRREFKEPSDYQFLYCSNNCWAKARIKWEKKEKERQKAIKEAEAKQRRHKAEQERNRVYYCAECSSEIKSGSTYSLGGDSSVKFCSQNCGEIYLKGKKIEELEKQKSRNRKTRSRKT